MRKTICRSERLAVLVVGALLAPAAAAAQVPVDSGAVRADSTTRTHVVRRGDTLWDLAIEYLRNPRRWPEIHRANRDVVENPHWIYPGERIRIPGAAPADAVATAAGAPTAGAPIARPAVVGGVRLGATADSGATFLSPELGRVASPEELAARRLADYLAAPYLERRGGPGGAGRVHATAPGIVAESTDGRWLHLGDAVRITMPAGTAPEVGQKLLAYALGPAVGDGQVVRPTGIVEVREFEGNVVRGRVIVVLDKLRDGQGVLALPPAPADPVRGTDGAAGRVIWVEGDTPLPALQAWLMLAPQPGAALAEQGEVALYRRPDPASPGAVAQRLGTARIVRVTPYAASALLTAITQPGIAVGTDARVAGQ